MNRVVIRGTIGLVSLILFLTFALIPWPAWGQKIGGTLKVGIKYDDASRLDGRYLGPYGTNMVETNIYDYLVDYGPSGMSEIVPGLAERWEKVDDLTYIFHIRKGVKFHNGRELTSQDIKTNYDWLINTPQGWRPINYREFLAPLDRVEVVDRYTMKMILKHPYPPLLPLLRYVKLGIVPPEEVEKLGKDFGRRPVGTGPFKVVEAVPGSHIILERFADYWGPKPKVDRLMVRTIPDDETRLIALQSGDIDIAVQLDETARRVLEKDPKFGVYSYHPIGMQFRWHFNVRRWPMSSAKFRRAIAMGVPWDKVGRVVYPLYGARLSRTLLDVSWAENPEAVKLLPAYDPKKARELIEEVEAEAGRKIPPLSAIAGIGPQNANVLEMAKTELKKIGVELTTEPLEMGQLIFRTLLDKKIAWDIVNLPGASVAVDPYMAIAYFESHGNMPDGRNRLGYINQRVDSLLKQALEAKTRGERTKLYQEAERTILSDLPAIPLFYMNYITGINKKVKGFKPHDSGSLYITRGWIDVGLD